MMNDMNDFTRKVKGVLTLVAIAACIVAALLVLAYGLAGTGQ